MFNEISGYPVAHSSWHIKLTITVFFRPFHFGGPHTPIFICKNLRLWVALISFFAFQHLLSVWLFNLLVCATYKLVKNLEGKLFRSLASFLCASFLSVIMASRVLAHLVSFNSFFSSSPALSDYRMFCSAFLTLIISLFLLGFLASPQVLLNKW